MPSASFAGEGTPRERRWAVIRQDGSHGWLGRHTDPTEAEIANVIRQLEERGVTAWLAVTEGVYFEPAHDLTVLMVRPLVDGGDWDLAKTKFLKRRVEAIKS